MPLPPGPVSVTSRTSGRRSSAAICVDLPLAAEERRGGNRQVRLVQRLQRREVVRAELEDALGRAQVLQPVQAEVAHLGAGEVGGRLRQEHLAAVPGGRDPRRPMHVEPDVALVGPERFPRVQAHPHAHRAVRKRALRVGGGRDRVGRARKRDEERVALRVDLDPVVPPPGLPQRTAVLGEHVGVPSPSSWSSRVDPSMSVKRNVTVPVGSSGCIWRFSLVSGRMTTARSTGCYSNEASSFRVSPANQSSSIRVETDRSVRQHRLVRAGEAEGAERERLDIRLRSQPLRCLGLDRFAITEHDQTRPAARPASRMPTAPDPRGRPRLTSRSELVEIVASDRQPERVEERATAIALHPDCVRLRLEAAGLCVVSAVRARSRSIQQRPDVQDARSIRVGIDRLLGPLCQPADVAPAARDRRDVHVVPDPVDTMMGREACDDLLVLPRGLGRDADPAGGEIDEPAGEQWEGALVRVGDLGARSAATPLLEPGDRLLEGSVAPRREREGLQRQQPESDVAFLSRRSRARRARRLRPRSTSRSGEGLRPGRRAVLGEVESSLDPADDELSVGLPLPHRPAA